MSTGMGDNLLTDKEREKMDIDIVKKVFLGL